MRASSHAAGDARLGGRSSETAVRPGVAVCNMTPTSRNCRACDPIEDTMALLPDGVVKRLRSFEDRPFRRLIRPARPATPKAYDRTEIPLTMANGAPAVPAQTETTISAGKHAQAASHFVDRKITLGSMTNSSEKSVKDFYGRGASSGRLSGGRRTYCILESCPPPAPARCAGSSKISKR